MNDRTAIGPDAQQPGTSSRIRGWHTVAAGAITLTCAGAVFQILGLDYSSLVAGHDGDAATLGTIIFAALAAESALFVALGWYVDRRGSRRIMLSCFAVAAAVCFLTLGVSLAPMRGLLIFGVSMVSSLGSQTVVATAVNRRFRRRRATAMALLLLPNSAISFTAAVLTAADPVRSALASHPAIITAGAAMAALAWPVTKLVSDEPPRDEAGVSTDETTHPEHAARDIFRGRQFWQIALGATCGILAAEAGFGFASWAWVESSTSHASATVGLMATIKLLAFPPALVVTGLAADRTSIRRSVAVALAARLRIGHGGLRGVALGMDHAGEAADDAGFAIGRPQRNSFSRLWPVQISDHSPCTFSSPRSRN